MRSTRPAWLIGFALAAILNLGLASSAVAESDLLSWEPATTVTFTFDETKDPAAAHGSAILRNPSPFNLSITLRLEGNEKVDAASVTPANFTIGPGAAMEIELTVPGSKDLVGLKGSLVAQGRPPSNDIAVGPALVAFEIVGTETKPDKQLAEPASVTMTVDRCWPSPLIGVLDWLNASGARDCLVYWPPSSSSDPDRPTAVVTIHGLSDLSGAPTRWRLSGDTGTTEMAITGPAATPTPEPTATAGPSASAAPSQSAAPGASAEPSASPDNALKLQVARPGAAGKYSGDIPVVVGVKDTPSIPTTVHVQDFVLWPVIAIFLSAFFSYRLVPKLDEARSRHVLDARLVEIFEETGDRSCQFPLTAFPEPERPPPPGANAKPRWPRIATNPLTPAEEVHIAIYQVPTREGLELLGKRVEELAAVVAQWKLACKRRVTLIEHFANVKAGGAGIPEDAQISMATEGLINRSDAFRDLLPATQLATLLSDQADALTAWAKAWVVLRTMQPLWAALNDANNLTPEQRETVVGNNPDGLFDAFLRTATNLDEMKQREPERRLREVHATLSSLAKSLGVEPVALDEAFAGAGPPDIPRDVPPPAPSASIFRRIVWNDWAQLLGLGVAAAIVYLSTIYPGHDFGSPWHYTTALLAGVTTGLVIKWELLPWARSYRPAIPKP